MPKLGMEPIRREALVNATISEIGQTGSLDVTVGQIARRAGVSSALAHHYFGGKDELFIAAMRHILTLYGTGVREALAGARDPRARIAALLQASFTRDQFRHEIISAWLNFYVQALTSMKAGRLLRVYKARLHSNLTYALRPLIGVRAPAAAEIIAAQIDGIYIRAALSDSLADGDAAAAQVMALVDLLIAAPPADNAPTG